MVLQGAPKKELPMGLMGHCVSFTPPQALPLDGVCVCSLEVMEGKQEREKWGASKDHYHNAMP